MACLLESGGCRSPVFQQQGPQDVGSVLGFDLVGYDHLFHHLVGDVGQGRLVQIQQHRTCVRTRTELCELRRRLRRLKRI